MKQHVHSFSTMEFQVAVQTELLRGHSPRLCLHPMDMSAAGLVSGELIYVKQMLPSTQTRLPAVVIASLWPELSLKQNQASLHMPEISTLIPRKVMCLISQIRWLPVAESISLQVTKTRCNTSQRTLVAADDVLSHLEVAVEGTAVAAGTYFWCRTASGEEWIAQVTSIAISYRKDSARGNVPALGRVESKTDITIKLIQEPQTTNSDATADGISMQNQWFVHFMELAGSMVSGTLNSFPCTKALEVFSNELLHQRIDFLGRGDIFYVLSSGAFHIDCLKILAVSMINTKLADAELIRLRSQIASNSRPILFFSHFDAVRLLCSNSMPGHVRHVGTTFWKFLDSLPQLCPAIIGDVSVDIKTRGISMWTSVGCEFRSLDLKKRATLFAEVYANLTCIQKHSVRKVCQLQRKTKKRSYISTRSQARLEYLAGLKSKLQSLDYRRFSAEVTSVNRLPTCGSWEQSSTRAVESVRQMAATDWADIGGLEPVKNTLREILEWSSLVASITPCLNVVVPRGILLFGPPGCSKTMLARAVATEGGRKFMNVQGPALMSKWLGESERAVRHLFHQARACAPSIIFLDEIDAVTMRRSDGGSNDAAVESTATDRVLSQLLAEFDGIQLQADVLIVGATNRPDLMDPALLRPGRMDQLVYIPPPDIRYYGEILCLALKHTPISPSMSVFNMQDLIGSKCPAQFSGADLIEVARKATIFAVEENSTCVSLSHLETALTLSSPSIDRAMLLFYQNWVSLSAPIHLPF
mmetsp:Transcript_14094/g.42116  ORF Transcript_14094/g.42116 Transcript_14094/m.42116 type:complete len:756 (+) Transcript_14094:557-2824(+)